MISKQTIIARIFACIILLTGFTLLTPDHALAQWGGPGCDTSNPDADNDGDGMTNGEELANGTDPCDADSDGDGMDDQEEDAQLTNPLVADTDGDSLTDGVEFNDLGTSPLLYDTSGDGLSDHEAITLGLDPFGVDEDNDGLLNGVEVELGTSPFSPNTDRDDINDFDEILLGTDPTVPDSSASIQAACNALGSEHSVMVCNAYNSGDTTPPSLNKDTGVEGTQVQGCASAGANSSGMPSYFILFALIIMANVGLRKRQNA